MIARTCLAGVALLFTAVAFAQRGAPNESLALSHVYSAFVTGTDVGVLSPKVALGPELQQRLGLAAQPDAAKAYQALMALVGDSTKDVRRATPKEIGDYGARRGFDAGKNPVFTLDAGGVQLLVQYDPRATRISYVGQLGVADPDRPPPAPVAVEDVMKALAELPGKPAQPIVGTVTFEYDSAKLTPQARAALGELVPKAVDRRLQVSGHADGIGSDEYNQRLSRQRAEAVRAYLVESGVAADKIELFAHGKAQPVKACPEGKKPSALRSCLAPNRRVVIEAL